MKRAILFLLFSALIGCGKENPIESSDFPQYPITIFSPDTASTLGFVILNGKFNSCSRIPPFVYGIEMETGTPCQRKIRLQTLPDGSFEYMFEIQCQSAIQFSISESNKSIVNGVACPSYRGEKNQIFEFPSLGID